MNEADQKKVERLRPGEATDALTCLASAFGTPIATELYIDEAYGTVEGVVECF